MHASLCNVSGRPVRQVIHDECEIDNGNCKFTNFNVKSALLPCALLFQPTPKGQHVRV